MSRRRHGCAISPTLAFRLTSTAVCLKITAALARSAGGSPNGMPRGVGGRGKIPTRVAGRGKGGNGELTRSVGGPGSSRHSASVWRIAGTRSTPASVVPHAPSPNNICGSLRLEGARDFNLFKERFFETHKMEKSCFKWSSPRFRCRLLCGGRIVGRSTRGCGQQQPHGEPH
jgi:hypothetical protein